MFGCIAAGRLVQTNLQQVDVNKYIFELSEAQSIHHLVVFLLGTIPFEPGFAATVHLLWPNKNWQLLGGLSNEKPSAIFKINNKGNNMNSNTVPANATLGISIEPIATVEQQLSTLTSGLVLRQTNATSSYNLTQVPMSNIGQMAVRVLENLYNYVNSFTVDNIPVGAIPLGQLTDKGYLPVKAFQTWYDNLSRKLANDPNYLISEKSA
ncbi:unnamed protein product [Cunninghamella echinulata]